MGRSLSRRRAHLAWLLVPYLLFLGAVPLVNRVRPLVLGVPFLFVWLFLATVLTPVAVALARRGDHRDRRDRRAGAARGGLR
ncbi:DUF3311 domain-containing protein [Streptomyces sp. URMC 123]|uniref:DUF3311 domain-containing protein n=1 Tax=Streptomyces sp. URMC 123 TaxID=3423403 RepID=UPI003F1AA6E2